MAKPERIEYLQCPALQAVCLTVENLYKTFVKNGDEQKEPPNLVILRRLAARSLPWCLSCRQFES